MRKVLIVMDDINYRGGAHFATFKMANYLAETGMGVFIYSPHEILKETQKYLSSQITICNEKNYAEYEYVIVPFENSCFREEVAALEGIKKIQWVHIDYKKWAEIVDADIQQQKELFSCFDKIVFVSQHNLNNILLVFPELESKCIVIYNILDTYEIGLKSLAPIDSEIMEKHSDAQLNIVVSGRLEPQKSYQRLIDIAKILNEQGTKIEWHILGKGKEYDILKQKCLKYSITNIHFWGFRQNPYPFVKAADIFALLSEYEGLALVIAESLSLGTPVLATESGGVREILADEYGWIVKNDIYSIINTLQKIYSDRKLISEKRKKLKNYQYNNEGIKKELNRLFEISDNTSKSQINYVPDRNLMTNKDVDISVVVPVYNTEKYLKECLESLVQQTYDNLEIIIVNDGSTDHSERIIADYVYHYPDKIRAFSIKNSGLGEARNYGIRKARGQYIGFVDSDDTVQPEMFQKMYAAAQKNDSDCVMCDYIAIWDSGKKEYIHSLEGNVDRFEILKYSSKYGVVNACTKLIHKNLMNKVSFPKGFYEDLATTPILLSYAKNIHYVREGLYNYRQRTGSITSIKNNDSRLLDCYAAWDRILNLSNPLYENEIHFAVYWSINFFCTNFLENFAYYSKKYFDSNKKNFLHNSYIQKAVENGQFINFEQLPEIPKIIHYCKFGNGDTAETFNQCYLSWKKYAPDYKIIEWNESNCDIKDNPILENAYSQQDWTILSEYFRLKALKNYGGIALDSDMELLKPLDELRCDSFFLAFETSNMVQAGIIGAEKNCIFIERLLTTYKASELLENKDFPEMLLKEKMLRVLLGEGGFYQNGKTQHLRNGGKIYSANVLTINVHDGNCIVKHHYDICKPGQKVWCNGYEVIRQYFASQILLESNEKSSNSSAVDYERLYKEIQSSTFWRMTKPLRIFADFCKKIKCKMEGKNDK